MNNKLKGGIIGAGKMGLVHGAIINSLPGAKVVALAEPTKLIKRAFSQFAPDINFFDNHNEMLSSQDLDFVFITSPSYMHVGMALDCIEKNCNIFVEKPLAINGNEAAPLIRKLKEKKLVSMTGYMMRYVATFLEAKKILNKSLIGDIITFNARMYVSQLFKKGKGWRYDKNKSGGGVIITQATHAIDLICWYFGFPRNLNAHMLSPYSEMTEDFGHINFNWENGLMGWLDSSWSVFNHRLLETTITIHGRNGNIEVNDDTIKLFLKEPKDGYKKGWSIIRKPEIESGVIIDIGGPQYTRQNEDFIKSILNNKQVESDVFNAYKIQKIVDSIYLSGNKKGELQVIDYEF